MLSNLIRIMDVLTIYIMTTGIMKENIQVVENEEVENEKELNILQSWAQGWIQPVRSNGRDFRNIW